MKSLLLIFLLYIGLFLQTWGSSFFAWAGVVPDGYFLVVLYLALILPGAKGAFWCWIFGLMRDGVACISLGTYGTVYLLLALVIHGLGQMLDSRRGYLLYGFMGCFFTNQMVLWWIFSPKEGLILTGQTLFLSLYTSLYLPPVFLILSPLRKISWTREPQVGDCISHQLLFHWRLKEEENDPDSPLLGIQRENSLLS